MGINLDMDGVLANFVDGALKIHGKPDHKVTKWNFFEDWGISEDQFWEPIHAMGAEFWENLEPYPWAKDLVKLVSEHDENFVILTKPSRHESCEEGKLRWRDRYFPGVPLVFADDKWVHCEGRHDILIDDSDKNCDDWWEAGGYAILFPQPWNIYGKLHIEPIEFVQDMLEGQNEHCAKFAWSGATVVRDMPNGKPLAEGDMIVTPEGGKHSHVAARLDLIPPQNQLLLGECLAFGAGRYGECNWQKIPQRDNLNHAMVHITKWMAGDRTEPHLVNALARVNFALWHAVEDGEQPKKYIHPSMVKA